MANRNNPKKIIYYIVKELPTILLTLIFGVGYNVAFVIVPSFQGALLDTVIDGKPLNTIAITAAIFIAIVLAVQVARYFKRYFVRSFANKTRRTMRINMYRSTINHSLDNLNTGDIMTRCIGDIEITVEGIRKSITEILDTGIAMISYIVALLAYDSVSTAISCSFVVGAMLIALMLKSLVYRYTKAYRESAAKLTGCAYELTSNVLLFRSNGVMATQTAAFDEVAQKTKAASIKASLIENCLPPLYKVIASVGVVFVIYFGGMRVQNGLWTIGVFTAYLTLFLNFTIKASKISKLFNTVQKAQISWRRTRDYFDVSDEKEAKIPNLDSAALAVKDLSFAYEDNKNVCLPLSFAAKSGDIVGITGEIASGKTAILTALTAQYGYNGSVELNGKELDTYTRGEITGMIAYSGHNACLLDDTIAENVDVGRGVDYMRALNAVCFDKDFECMPKRELTAVGNNGVRLSGGQQARISLARAIAGRSKIILLDDPFSAVDQVTEQAIIDNLRRDYSDKLFIITSHRPTIYGYSDGIVTVIASEKEDKNA